MSLTPFQVKRKMATLVLVSCLFVNGVSSLRTLPRLWEAEHIQEACPPCEMLFSKLERTGKNGKLTQDVRVQERGEPKSGTGIIYSWTTAALINTCDYLQGLFGKGSCRIDAHPGQRPQDRPFSRYCNRSMTFDPSLGTNDARCSCDTVDRVLVTTSKANKHTLPVYASGDFSHGIGIGIPDGEAEGVGRQPPCTFEDGSPVNNQDDLWRCMHEAHCDITDDWIQMAVFRDPRPAIVSTFYHVKLHTHKEIGTLEAFVARELPISCQWLAVRYILFAGILADQSIEVWYNDAMNDPLGWHYRWFYSVGLQLPFHIVEATAQAAAADDLGFKHKPIDLHPGEELRGKQGLRQFEDEVSPEILAIANDVLRTWLPPVLLERFGVEP